MRTVAMLYPGHSAEDEFPRLESLIHECALPVLHTWDGPTEHDVAALRALGSGEQLVPAARAAVDQLDPDAIMWACTSGSFVYGPEGVHEQASWMQAATGRPASSTSIAFIEAVHHLRLTRVAVVATYPPSVSGHFTALLSANDINIAQHSSADIPTGEDAGRLAPQEVLALLDIELHPEAQAVLVPDTALHTVEAIPELERRLRCPVLTANQVTAWYGLRLAGWSGRASLSLGHLFAS